MPFQNVLPKQNRPITIEPPFRTNGFNVPGRVDVATARMLMDQVDLADPNVLVTMAIEAAYDQAGQNFNIDQPLISGSFPGGVTNRDGSWRVPVISVTRDLNAQQPKAVRLKITWNKAMSIGCEAEWF